MKTHEREQSSTLEDLYQDLTDLEPKLVSTYVPEDAKEQREAFLKDDIVNPDHNYSKLEAIDFKDRFEEIDRAGSRLIGAVDNPKFTPAYQDFVDGYRAKTALMQAAHAYKSELDLDEKERLRDEFMTLNAELYGEPDEVTYRSLLNEKMSSINEQSLEGRADQIRRELVNLTESLLEGHTEERFKPSVETVEWIHGVASELYGGMLGYVPDQDTFNEHEVQTIFTAILHDEFGGAADDWRVDVEPAKSINVKSVEKRVVIPDDRGEISRATLEKLIVHEIGVHVLRSVMGESTNLPPLRNGLNDYYDSEEGLGKVMEQALAKKYTEAGVDHYITAGLAHFDNRDFREAFEVKWRLSVLEGLKAGNISEEQIEKARIKAYNSTMRTFRGTDELPWFKDLSYFNGTADVWRHLEAIRGDELKFMFMLLGKGDASKASHERVLYETSTV